MGCVEIAQESKQELGLGPKESQQDLVTILAGQDAVHLGGDRIGVVGQENLVILEGAVFAAGSVDLEFPFAARQFTLWFSG